MERNIQVVKEFSQILKRDRVRKRPLHTRIDRCNDAYITRYPLHRENGPKDSLSGKIQGIWKFLPKHREFGLLKL